MTGEQPSFNVSHQCLQNVSIATSHCRQSNPVNRTISGAAISSIISVQSPSDNESKLYDLYANIMEILNHELDDNQATIQLTDFLQNFVDNLDGSIASLFANESIDDILNGSVRFRESFEQSVSHTMSSIHSQPVESIVVDEIDSLPGADLDDVMADEYHVTQFDQMIATESAETVNSPQFATLETVRSIFSSQLDGRHAPSSLPTFSSGNNQSNIRSPDRKLRKTDFSTDSSPKIYKSINNAEAMPHTQFFTQITKSYSSQIFDDEEDVHNVTGEFDNSTASVFCSPPITINSNNVALIEVVYADPADIQPPLKTPERFAAPTAKSLHNYIIANVDSPMSVRESPINNAAFTP